MESFRCGQCQREVSMTAIGTEHRNHCPFCLWSKHLDKDLPGDRASSCLGMMKPVCITFKNKQGEKGELMLVHNCMKCGVVEKNRIAGDDDPEVILKVYETSLVMPAEECNALKGREIIRADELDEKEILTQLFGRPEAERRLSQE